MQRSASFLFQIWKLQGFFVPADRNLRHALFKEALGEPGIGLHQVGEGVAAIDELADLLQLADSFVEESHFPEGYSQVVVRLWIFVGVGRIMFKLLL